MTVTDPTSGITSYTHDMMGDVTSLTDPDDNTTNWTYDGLGRVIEETDPLGHSEYYQYDLSGNLTEKIDRDGRVTEYTYDHLNRETHEYWYANTTDAENDPNHTSAEETFSYAYDANNDLLTASDASATAANASATYNFEYGAVGWVVQTTAQITGLTPTVTLSSISGHAYAPDLGQDVPLPNYDANGNRLGLKVSIGSTDDFSNTYTYDNLGRLTSVTQSGQGGNAVAPKRVDFTYDADNQDATITQYADLAGTQQVATGAYTYDHAGRLTGLTYTQPNSTGLPSYGWSYDAAGQVTQMVMPDGTVNYTNDGTGQLTAATSTGDPNLNESHSYDSNGNRTDTGCSTGTNNRLLSDGTFTYTYDNEGNRISRTRISSDPADDYQTLYTWDNRNRLTSVTFKDNNGDTTKTVTYLYDVFDRWIGETIAVPGQAVQQTRFVYDGNQIVLQFDKTGTGDLAASDLSHRYLWGPAVDQLLADEHVTSAWVSYLRRQRRLAVGRPRGDDPRPGGLQLRHRRDDDRQPSSV